MYIPETGKIRSDCDVKFDENKIGYESLNKWDENDQTNNRNLIIVGLNSINEDDDDMEQFDEGRRTETKSSEYEDAILEESDEDGMQNENDNEELQDQREEIRNKGRLIEFM